MTGHLIESTILLAIAVAAAHLPRLAARTRYAVVFLALVKFAVPWKLPSAAKGTIAITLPGPIAAAPHAFAAPSVWPAVVKALWLAIAAALFLLILWRARRAISEALRGAVPATEREQALVPRRGVVLLRSHGCGAPAAIGILRPRIVIPASLDLGDDELAAILAHECAHIARRDNLLALIDAAFGAALWFHPLVWIARRILARAREEACDESVVARGGAEVYVGALAKVCRAAAAPHVAGVSCIVSNNILERMNAIMNLPSRSALPHRLVVAVALALLACASLLHAQEKSRNYTMQLAVARDAHGNFDFDITVIDNTSGQTVAHPHVNTPAGVPASITADESSPAFKIEVRGENDGTATATMQVYDASGKLLESTAMKAVSKQSAAPSGQKITINLKDASLVDVVNTFGKLANLATKIDPDVDGKVSIELREVPWDQALQKILFDNNCEYEVSGSTIHVRRIR